MKKLIAFIIAITTILVIALQPAQLPKASGLASLDSDSDLRRIALALAQRNNQGYNLYRDDFMMESLAPSLDSKANQVTQTNTQIQGIDEADTIKSDGVHVYTLFENTLRMYKIEDNTLRLVKTVKFDYEKISLQSMFLVEDQLVILASSGGWWWRGYEKFIPETNEDEVKPDPGVSEPPSDGDNDVTEPVDPDKPSDDDQYVDIMPMPPYNGSPLTQHVIVLDKTTLNTEQTLKIEGNLIGARLNGTQMILITSKYNWVEPNAVNSIDSKDVLPVISLNDVEFTFDVKDIQYINQPETLNMLTITKFDLSDMSTSFKHLLMDSHTLYMNHDTILLAATSWTYNERSMWGKTTTHIYSLSYKDEVTLKASASLEGNLLNQFAMDEYNGVVRVALTVWGEKTTNSIVTLNKDLEVLDRLTGLAPTESIYSVRFVQDRAYVVTFEQIDPFFVIDLSTPTNIKVLGELKIPGYSTYLHPLSDTLVLGFGRDVKVEPDGRLVNGAMKLSLFDVSDESQPTEKINQLIGNEYSWGDISYDHKALMVNPQKQLLGFFVTSSVVTSVDGREDYKTLSTYYVISTANESIKIYDEINIEDTYQVKAIMVNNALHILLPNGRVVTEVYP
jgi:inhibitor of cysteine peptidase